MHLRQFYHHPYLSFTSITPRNGESHRFGCSGPLCYLQQYPLAFNVELAEKTLMTTWPLPPRVVIPAVSFPCSP